MNISVIGAGALGCALGARLAEAGHEVALINRNHAHVEAINQRGLRIREDGVERVVRIHAATDCSAFNTPADLVLILVKSFHTREAIEMARPVVGERTIVLSLQNGLGHEEILGEVTGPGKVIAGKTYAGGVLTGPGQIIAGLKGRVTYIGELDGSNSERVQGLAVAFQQAGLATIVSDNIVGTMWDKLLVNVATGALSAITRLPYGALYGVPQIEECAIAAVAEAMAVARACGIQLSITNPRDAWMKASAGLPADFKASMLQSLERGSITEVDFIHGAVVRRGAMVNVPTPVNNTLLACVKGIEVGLPRRDSAIA